MDKLLTPKQVAEIFQVKPGTISVWVKRKIAPPYLRQGRTLRFRESAVEKFILDKEHRDRVKNFKD